MADGRVVVVVGPDDAGPDHDGKVEADEAVILGRIKGTLKGNKVRLAASSRIEGDTYHQVIAIEDGAIYEGSIKRIKTS